MDTPRNPKRFWALAAAVAIIIFIDIMLSAPARFPVGGTFTITEGESLGEVARALAADGYVRWATVFEALAAAMGGEHRVSPGDYHFPAKESGFGVAAQIAFGHHDIDPIKVTVPEGDTVSDIAALLAQKIPGFDTKTFVALATPDEGYLFPETYFLYPTTTPAEIVAEMRAMFDAKTAGLFTPAALNGRTEADIVTMASLIEREASGDDDRATIAGILWKRISLGMRLQVDAAPDTYLHAGLPAAPIANPGLQALDAAMNPVSTPYLYYLHDKNGTIHYAKTYAEHQANIAKYLN